MAGSPPGPGRRPSRSPSHSRASSRSSTSTSSSERDQAAITARLQLLARDAKASRVPFEKDGSEHYRVFCRAISNLLSTELVLFTFAQIIDGLPTADVAWDRRYPDLHGEHPIEQHEDICPGVLDKARQFRRDFDPSILSFDPKTLRSFRKASLGSRQFNTRLIELVAVAMHEIGTLLFQLGLRMHEGDIEAVDQWREKPDELFPAGVPPRPTIFNHHGYLHHDLYPDGVADVVGYWAEDRILGGVTVFDRQSEQRAPQFPPNVYFHSCRAKLTKRYYQLRDDQEQALLDFLVAENPDPSRSPLPITADRRNVVRVNEEEAVLRHFYRDVWERKPPTREDLKFLERAPRNVVDYPEYEGFIKHLNTFPTVTITVPSGPRGNAAPNDKDGDDKTNNAIGEGQGSKRNGGPDKG